MLVIRMTLRNYKGQGSVRERVRKDFSSASHYVNYNGGMRCSYWGTHLMITNIQSI